MGMGFSKGFSERWRHEEELRKMNGVLVEIRVLRDRLKVGFSNIVVEFGIEALRIEEDD